MGNTVSVTDLELKSFRCFKEKKLTFDAPVIFIQGDNGSGKTSILEALFYSSNMRSFKSNSPKELASFESDQFFIRMRLANEDLLQIGFAQKKKRVRFNNNLITHHQELAAHYHAIAISQNDVSIIQEG